MGSSIAAALESQRCTERVQPQPAVFGSGERALRVSVAQSDVDVAKAQLDEVRLDVRVRVHKAFDNLLLAQNEMQIHHQHVAIARQAIEAARIQYAVGKVPQ